MRTNSEWDEGLGSVRDIEATNELIGLRCEWEWRESSGGVTVTGNLELNMLLLREREGSVAIEEERLVATLEEGPEATAGKG